MRGLLIIGLVTAVLAFSISLAFRLGAFMDVSIQTEQVAEIRLLVKKHVGAYHQIVSSLQDVEGWARAHKVTCQKTIAKFLDNPEVIEESRLRSSVGCVLEPTQVIAVDDLPKELSLDTVPSGKYIRADFDGSPSIGPFKVYSKVQRLANDERIKLGGWNVEIYDIHGPKEMHTEYLFPVETPGS